MGSKWIPVSEAYPPTDEIVWVLVHTPRRTDKSVDLTYPEKREVQLGYRYDRSGVEPDFRWWVANDTLDDGFYMVDDVEHWDHGETTEIKAWMPIERPLAEVIE